MLLLTKAILKPCRNRLHMTYDYYNGNSFTVIPYSPPSLLQYMDAYNFWKTAHWRKLQFVFTFCNYKCKEYISLNLKWCRHTKARYATPNQSDPAKDTVGKRPMIIITCKVKGLKEYFQFLCILFPCVLLFEVTHNWGTTHCAYCSKFG